MNRGLFERLQEELDVRQPGGAFGPLDLLELSDELQGMLRRIMRRGPTSADQLAEELGEPSSQVAHLLSQLASQGYLAAVPDTSPTQYRVALGKRRARALPEGLWSSLTDRLAGKQE